MSFPDSPHDAFHGRLNHLLQLVYSYVNDLVTKAKRDDALMAEWKTNPNLSERQIRQREEFESYVAAWDDFDGLSRLTDSTPEDGAESRIRITGYNSVHVTPQIEEAFIKCREAIGYSADGETPRRALKVLEESLVDFRNMIDGRLRQEWPRPSIADIERDVRMCCYYLRSRELDNVLNHKRTEQKWWRGRPDSPSQINVPIHPKPNKDDASEGLPSNHVRHAPADAISKSKESSRTVQAKQTTNKTRVPSIETLVTPDDVALRLKETHIIISPKTLRNTRKAEWGKPDGFEGKAELFDWERIRPIVESQFNVKFDE